MLNDKCDNPRSPALQYLCKDLSIFPLIPRGNKPIPSLKWGSFPQILSTHKQLKSWFDGTDNNIAFVTRAVSRLLAKSHPDDAIQNRIHQDTLDAILDTIWVETGGEGIHILIRYNSQELREGNSAASEFRNFILWRDKGRHSEIRLKADGGYVVTIPSIYSDGKPEPDTDHLLLISHDLLLQNLAEACT